MAAQPERKRIEFAKGTKQKAFDLRKGKCPGLVEMRIECGRDLSEGVEYDHIAPCQLMLDNSLENCRPLCRICHAIKTTWDQKRAAKMRRLRGENKPRLKAAIKSRGFPSKQEIGEIKKRYGAKQKNQEHSRHEKN